jgi:putative ABC transport system permease protein
VPVVVIDEKTAQNFWPDQDPIGKRLTFESAATSPEPNAPRTPIWRLVVGVAGNVKHYGLSNDAKQAIYVPYLQAPEFYRGILPPMNLIVHCASQPQAMVNAVRREVAALDGNLPIYNVNTMDTVLSNSVAKTRLSVWLMGSFAVVGLILAAVGVYGVNSYYVTQRRHEIGVRMALGAQPRDVLRMVLGQGMLLSVVGLVVGITGTYLLVPVMSSLLWGVSTTDPITFVGISMLLIIVALIACYLPARRATKVDPMIALRYE